MQSPIFITGIGTDVGKTLVAAIVTEALEADYWKPVQAGLTDGTDAEKIQSCSVIRIPWFTRKPIVYKHRLRRILLRG